MKKQLTYWLVTFLLPAWLLLLQPPVVLASSGYSSIEKDTGITLTVRNRSLKETLLLLERQTHYRFVYNPRIVDMAQLVTIVADNEDLQIVLRHLSDRYGLEFTRSDKLITIRTKPKIDGKMTVLVIESLKGRVLDRVAGNVLAGTSVMLSGKNRVTMSDVNGEFQLTSLAPGKHTLSFSFVGYRDTSMTVNIQSGANDMGDIYLQPASGILTAVVIEGALLGQMKALNQQRGSNTIKNIVSSDQMGRFPDPNAAEALQRIPGVNINRNSGDGEGRYVGLRGLPPSFTNIYINGEQTPSPEGEVRQTALDVIPSDQLASMEITKALTPDMDGDAISGSINLITRSATSREWAINATLGPTLEQNYKSRPGQQGAFMVAKRFGGDVESAGKFGVLANLTYLRSNRNVDQVESDYEVEPDGLKFGTYELEDAYYIRERLGLNTKLDFRPNEHTEIYFTGLFTQLYELDESRRFGFSLEDNEIFRRIKHRQENQGVQAYNLGSKHLFPTFKLDFEVSHSRGNSNTPYEYLPVFGFEVDELLIDRTDHDRPHITAANRDGQPVDWNDDSQFAFIEHEYSGTTARSRSWTAKFNIDRPFDFGTELSGALKFGAKARSASRYNRMDFYHLYEFNGSGDSPLLSQYDFTQGGDRRYDRDLFGSDYRLPSSVEWQPVDSYIKANSSEFVDTGSEDVAEEIANSNYELQEDVYAGYVMGTLNLKKWMLLAGARYEYTGLGIKTQYWNEDSMEAVPQHNDKEYGFLLPMAHVRYQVDPLSNIRFATTWSYARPNFVEYVSDDKVFSEVDREAYVGNPDLDPVGAFNMDLMYERYHGDVGLFSIGLFYKQLDRFIYTQVNNQIFSGVEGVNVFQSMNGGKATMQGIELAYQRNLTFLPGILRYIGVYANYTFTRGSANYNNRADREDENGNAITEERVDVLPGQSKHIANLALFFNKAGFSGRVASNFNSQFISGVGTNSLSDEYVADRWQLDASLSQRLNRRYQIFLEGTNLGNAPGVTFIGARSNPYEYRQFGTNVRLGVKFTY